MKNENLVVANWGDEILEEVCWLFRDKDSLMSENNNQSEAHVSLLGAQGMTMINGHHY